MSQTALHHNYRPRTKLKTLVVLALCVLGTVAAGWLCLLLSGAVSYAPAINVPGMPGRVFMSVIWTIFYLLAGGSLFLTITAHSPNSVYRAVRMWSLTLWGITAAMMFVWPFLIYWQQSYTLAFVWIAVSAASLSALIVLNFKLRPAAAFLLLPAAVWLFFSVSNVLYLVLNT